MIKLSSSLGELATKSFRLICIWSCKKRYNYFTFLNGELPTVKTVLIEKNQPQTNQSQRQEPFRKQAPRSP